MAQMTETDSPSAKLKLDLQLDRELEDTFPASDAPKITRTPHPSAAAPADPGESRDG